MTKIQLKKPSCHDLSLRPGCNWSLQRTIQCRFFFGLKTPTRESDWLGKLTRFAKILWRFEQPPNDRAKRCLFWVFHIRLDLESVIFSGTLPLEKGHSWLLCEVLATNAGCDLLVIPGFFLMLVLAKKSVTNCFANHYESYGWLITCYNWFVAS